MKRRKPLRLCRIKHSWSRWAYVKTDYGDGFEPEVRDELRFRMCRRCGHQELKEVELA
ncbi:hypothetical protein AB0942_33410 [Streptomyces nodosus]|uniref:hypothetical protein n=1 Tax=Streptomyces nodosus TaxID=40318 RepID=UPI003452A823